MLNKYFKFRKERNFGEIMKRDCRKEILPNKELFNMGYYFHDKYYRPVTINLLNAERSEAMFKNYSQEFFEEHFIQRKERLLHLLMPFCANLKKGLVDGMVLILDMKEVGFFGLFNEKIRAFVRTILDLGQDYYPETTSKIFIVNTPYFFA